MELASNLAWFAVCVVLFGSTVQMLRRGALQIGRRTGLTATLAVSLLLLPIISMSDDLLQAKQANLPLAAQSWHLANEAATTGLEADLLAGCVLLALLWISLTVRIPVEPELEVRRNAAWIMRSQRLRPPPIAAL